MPIDVDLAVIGAGPGGYVAAIHAAKQGLKVALIEKSEALGGTCLNQGCIPTKTLVQTANTFQTALEAERFGVKLPGKPVIDMGLVAKRLRSVVETLNKGVAGLIRKNAIQLIKGTACFTGPNNLTVQGQQQETVGFRHAIVATGSRPAALPGMPLVPGKVHSSDEILFRDRLPASLAIIGGGVIGCEFANVYSKLGVAVTVIEALPQIMNQVDAEVAAEVQKGLGRQGVKFLLGAMVQGIDTNGPACVVRLSDGQRVEAAEVLVSVGRRAGGEGLGLEGLGIKVERGIIAVDAQCRTSVPTIFAIGDVTGRMQLAHAASHDGLAVVDLITQGQGHFVDPELCPGNMWTEPEVGVVGLTEKAATAAKLPVKIGRFPYRALGRAVTTNEIHGFYKVVAEAKSGTILGVQIVGAHATDLIQQGTLMIAGEMTVESVGHLIHGHPTLSEGLMEACLAADNRQIHG